MPVDLGWLNTIRSNEFHVFSVVAVQDVEQRFFSFFDVRSTSDVSNCKPLMSNDVRVPLVLSFTHNFSFKMSSWWLEEQRPFYPVPVYRKDRFRLRRLRDR